MMDKYVQYGIIGGLVLILLLSSYNTCNIIKLKDKAPVVVKEYIKGKDSIIYIPKYITIKETNIPSETKDSIIYSAKSNLKQIQKQDTFFVKAEQSFNIDTKEFGLGLEIFYKAKETFRVDTLIKYIDRTIMENPPIYFNTYFWTTIALYTVVILQLIFN